MTATTTTTRAWHGSYLAWGLVQKGSRFWTPEPPPQHNDYNNNKNNNKLPSMGVGGEVEGAEGVALASHVLPKQVSRPVNLQVGLQIRLLLKRNN